MSDNHSMSDMCKHLFDTLKVNVDKLFSLNTNLKDDLNKKEKDLNLSNCRLTWDIEQEKQKLEDISNQVKESSKEHKSFIMSFLKIEEEIKKNAEGHKTNEEKIKEFIERYSDQDKTISDLRINLSSLQSKLNEQQESQSTLVKSMGFVYNSMENINSYQNNIVDKLAEIVKSQRNLKQSMAEKIWPSVVSGITIIILAFILQSAFSHWLNRDVNLGQEIKITQQKSLVIDQQKVKGTKMP